MRKIIVPVVAILVMLAGCGINKQIENAKAFEKCRYEITSADSLYVADLDVKDIIRTGNFNVLKAPRLALLLLKKEVPFEGRLNLQIKNPSSQLAAINQFEYKVLIKDHELASGLIDRTVRVQPNGGLTTVPIHINSNIYTLFADSKTQKDVADFFNGLGDDNNDTKSILTIKIKPTIGIGNKQIKYPGYITIDKEITKKIFL